MPKIRTLIVIICLSSCTNSSYMPQVHALILVLYPKFVYNIYSTYMPQTRTLIVIKCLSLCTYCIYMPQVHALIVFFATNECINSTYMPLRC